MWIGITAFIFLGICAVCDCVRKEIPLMVVVVGIITAALLHLKGVMGGTSWTAIGLSVLPGLFFWLLSFLTREKVGYGDGWMLIMIGLFTGFENCYVILLLGLVFESVAALVLLGFKKIRRDEEVPFAPFLLLGMGIVLWL